MNAREIANAIAESDVTEEEVKALGRVLKSKLREIVERRAAEFVTHLKTGDRVVFNERARPKYLCGVGATVRSIQETATGRHPPMVVLEIDLDARARRYSGTRVVGSLGDTLSPEAVNE